MVTPNGKFVQLRTIQNNSSTGNNRNIDIRLDFFKIRSAWNKGNLGNKRNIDFRMDCFKINSAWNKGNFGNNRNIDLRLDCFKIRNAGALAVVRACGPPSSGLGVLRDPSLFGPSRVHVPAVST